jgi:hypothetical protein
MATFDPFRLGAAAFFLLTLPYWTPVVDRCAGAESPSEGATPAAHMGAEGARRAADWRASARVFVAEVHARLLVVPDPDEAYSHLKTALDKIRDDPTLSERCRERLESRLQSDIEGVAAAGRVVKDLEVQWRALKGDLRIYLGLWRFE